MSQPSEPKVRDRRRVRLDEQGNPVPVDDAAPAEAQAEAASPESASEVEALKAELEATRKRVNDLAWALKSSERDREEFKQRIQRERDQLMDLERAKVATALLDTLDELDLSLKAAPRGDPLTQGVQLIRDGLLKRLVASGVERFDVVGEQFDPNAHEAADMEVVTTPDDDNRITGEVRAGYRVKDRIVRPARVKVARYVKPADA